MRMLPIVCCPVNRDSFSMNRLIYRHYNGNIFLSIMQPALKANVQHRLSRYYLNSGVRLTEIILVRACYPNSPCPVFDNVMQT